MYFDQHVKTLEQGVLNRNAGRYNNLLLGACFKVSGIFCSDMILMFDSSIFLKL